MTDNAIITAAQNIAIAINSLAKSTAGGYGTANSLTYAGGTTTQVVSGAGRLNNVTVIIGAAVKVNVYDSATTGGVSTSNILASVDATNVGTTLVNKVYKDGLVLVTGAGVSANITYSPS